MSNGSSGYIVIGVEEECVEKVPTAKDALKSLKPK